MASGVGVVCVRRDGVGVAGVAVSAVLVAAGVPGVAGLPGVTAAPAVLAVSVPAGLGWVVLAGVEVLLLVAVFAAGAFVLAPSLASPVPLAVASACACCSAVA